MNKKIAFAFAAMALVAGAQAATVYTDAGVGKTETNNAFTDTFLGSAASGVLTFDLNGYGSLDGRNQDEDDFKLTLNGTLLYWGTFNLGGGGDNYTYTDTAGATHVGGDSNPSNVSWSGGTVSFSVPVALQNGTNTLTFEYSSPKSGRQGLGDEGWGYSNVNVSAVPETATFALMLAGLGMVGGLARRRGRA